MTAGRRRHIRRKRTAKWSSISVPETRSFDSVTGKRLSLREKSGFRKDDGTIRGRLSVQVNATSPRHRARVGTRLRSILGGLSDHKRVAVGIQQAELSVW